MKPIAICKNEKIFHHSTQWTHQWIEFCRNNKIPYEPVDCYDSDVINMLDRFSVLLWHFSHGVLPDMMEARNILRVARNRGLRVFPDIDTSWHFDDKIAQMYLLQSIGASIPRSWVFYERQKCVDWLERSATYPIVAKLKSGSGSNNVKLLQKKAQAFKYCKRMFTKGFCSAPSVVFKATSKIRSSHDWSTLKNRIHRIPEFLRTVKNSKRLPIEKDYCYFQEMIPNDGFDIKVIVVGAKLTYLLRRTRIHDFRASGGGEIYFDNAVVTEQIRNLAFAICDKCHFQCMGFDFVIDNRTGEGKIIEMSYGFDWSALHSSGGYWERNGKWIDEGLIVPDEIIKTLLANNFPHENLL